MPEKITCEARRVAAAQERTRDVRELFVDAHHREMRDVTGELLAAGYRFEVDERDWLDKLHADAEADEFYPSSLAVLNVACSETLTAPAVLALGTTHTVHRVLRRTDHLLLGPGTGGDDQIVVAVWSSCSHVRAQRGVGAGHRDG